MYPVIIATIQRLSEILVANSPLCSALIITFLFPDITKIIASVSGVLALLLLLLLYNIYR
jgi:hypothetical protein